MDVGFGFPELDVWHLVSACVGGGSFLAVRALGRAVATDVAKRISYSLWGMRKIDAITPAFLRHPVWDGKWEVTWEVNSSNFEQFNTHRGRLYRCFNTIAIEGLGRTSSGKLISYGFTGKLSRDKSVATGVWFDRRWGDGGYHGVYQVRLTGTSDRASGLWCGFSQTTSSIKSDKLVWVKVGSK